MESKKENYYETLRGKKNLYLTISDKSFKEIEKGTTNILYLDLTNCWARRFIKDCTVYDDSGVYTGVVFKEKIEFIEYDYIVFRNGYGFAVPEMIIEFQDVSIGFGREEFGAERNEIYFRLLIKKPINKTILT